MKNYLIGTSLLFGSFITPSLAEESKDIYLSIGGGIAFPSDVKANTTLGGAKYDATFPTSSTGMYSIGIGKEINDYRVEFNYSGGKVDSNSITLTTGGNGVAASLSPKLELDFKSYMVYGFKDFERDSKFTPYIGIGAGISRISAKDQTTTVAGTQYQLIGSEEDVFSYSLKAGTNYEIAENTSLYAEAAYLNLASLTVDKGTPINYDSTNIFALTAGLKFNF